MQFFIKEFGDRFSTRPRARSVFNELTDSISVTFDFEGVQTATPSFLHEALIIFQEKKIDYSFINMSNSVNFQLQKALQAMD